MAYTQLGSRVTYYIGTGTTTAGNPFDVRGVGVTYYEQTAEDKANNQSHIKVEYKIQVSNGSTYSNCKYKVTASIQKKVNGSWTTVTTANATKSGTTATGTYTLGTIYGYVPHNDDGTGQTRTVVIIHETEGPWGTGDQSFYYIYDLPTIEATNPEINSITIGALARTAAITDLDVTWGRGCSLASITWDYGIVSASEHETTYTSIGSLTPNTTYWYDIFVRDTKGQASNNYTGTFTTLPNGNIPYKKINGTWTMGPYNYVKSSGAWTKANTTYYKSGGSWKTGP